MTSTETDDGTDEEETADQRPGSSGGLLGRRNLIRLLVGLGLGIPIAIEGLTFLGLIRTRLFGGDGSDGADGAPATPTRTETPKATIPPEGVGIGDELLPETPQVDRVTEFFLVPDGDRWTFSLTVEVENTGDTDYELQLASVVTEAGERITGDGATTGRVEPGTRGAVTGTWRVPAGSRIATVKPVAVSYPDETHTPSTVSPRVPLAEVPVREDTTRG